MQGILLPTPDAPEKATVEIENYRDRMKRLVGDIMLGIVGAFVALSICFAAGVPKTVLFAMSAVIATAIPTHATVRYKLTVRHYCKLVALGHVIAVTDPILVAYSYVARQKVNDLYVAELNRINAFLLSQQVLSGSDSKLASQNVRDELDRLEQAIATPRSTAGPIARDS